MENQNVVLVIPTGTILANGGTNYPGSPKHVGQLGAFRSPYSHSNILVDIAEIDRYGHLRWIALSIGDPRYETAVNEALKRKPISSMAVQDALLVEAGRNCCNDSPTN
jgi:hypothetical protein